MGSTRTITEQELRFINVAGVPLGVSDLNRATEWVLNWAKEGRGGLSVRLSNAYCLALADTNFEYKDLLVREGVNFPDGTPVVWAMRAADKHGRRAVSRVRGPSLFRSVLRDSRQEEVSHFFLGSTPETIGLLTDRVSTEFPGIKIAGAYAPEFGPLSTDFYDRAKRLIAESDADIVWVGLGTPKQDFATTVLAEMCDRPCIGVGAAFDFTAGTVPEAPEWIQRSGIEWLFRLASEPRRLWRRYVFGNLRFLAATWKGRNA